MTAGGGTGTTGSPGRPRRALAEIRAACERALRHRWVRHLVLLVAYEGAGIAVTWPRFTYLADSRLPATPDAASYVWYFWWTAHQLQHYGNPFFTGYMAAPVGVQLGFTTTMPLAAWLTTPITMAYGPSASFTLLSIITPGLLCYAMYRAARLWLNAPGAIAAGALFGLSSMLLWQNWYHVNIAMGSIFLPLTIEAAVRFRRRPHIAPAVGLGLALGASILVNQESAIIALFLAAAILLPWLAGILLRDRSALREVIVPLGIGAGAGLVVASPQLVAMGQQIASGGAHLPSNELALNYTQYGVTLPTLFAPSPRLADFGLAGLASAYSFTNPAELIEAVPTFGAVLTGLALLGAAAGRRRASTWWFFALWLVAAILALGTSITFGGPCTYSRRFPGVLFGPSCHQYLPLLGHLQPVLVATTQGRLVPTPVEVSNLMPYTWLVRIPGLSGLREADRFTIVGLIGAAMLAGLAVQWLSRRTLTRPVIAVVVGLGALEAGWSSADIGTMPTTLPAVDSLLTRDHSHSIVVDVPFGERGGIDAIGSNGAPNQLLIATHDAHPRAISYDSWVPQTTNRGITAHAFYRLLISVERTSRDPSPAQLRQARADLASLNVGWVLEWRSVWKRNDPGLRYAHIDRYLRAVGFRRVRVACMLPLSPRAHCPSQPALGNDQEVWLYRYEQGNLASPAGSPRSPIWSRLTPSQSHLQRTSHRPQESRLRT